MNDKQNSEVCETCYAIRCRQCGWVADETAVQCIQAGTLTACPECSWKPGDTVIA